MLIAHYFSGDGQCEIHSSPWLHENTQTSACVDFVISETDHSQFHITHSEDYTTLIVQLKKECDDHAYD